MSLADITSLQQRASAGDAHARYELGSRMLVGRGAPYSPMEGARLVNAAADQNHAAALQLAAVLAALGVGGAQNWAQAHALVARAARAGDERAKGQLAVLGEEFDPGLLRRPDLTQHHDAPRVFTAERFVSPAVCAWIQARARPSLEAARVKNPQAGGANVDAIRNNSGMGFSALDTDLVIQLAHARIAAATGVPVMQQEPTNILHYTPGQQYKPHFDFLDPGEAHFARELQQIGQRIVTALIYLNDDYEGGETDFPRLNWRFKGKTGDALIFWNVARDGAPERNSLHAGLPPASGEKWLFSKWIRDRALPLI